jgi:hypothetical protein
MTLPQSPTTIPHSPRTGVEAHAKAIQRLEDDDEAQGSERELSTAVELSAANERVAASETWLHYIERGY